MTNRFPYFSDYDQKKIELLDPITLLEYLKLIEEQEVICVYNQQERGNAHLNLFTTFAYHEDIHFFPAAQRQISFPNQPYYKLDNSTFYTTEYPLIYRRDSIISSNINLKKHCPTFNRLIFDTHNRIFEEERHFGYIYDDGSTGSLVSINTNEKIAFAHYSNLLKFLNSIKILETTTYQNYYLTRIMY